MATTETFELPVVSRPKRLLDRKPVRRALPWVVTIAMFLLWEAGVRLFAIPQFVLPAPSAIFASLWEWHGPILENSWQTLMTTLVGFAIAIVFGIGTVPAIITAFLISFFPILVNVATGIATVEPELRDVLRALGASKRQVIMKIGLPRAMPYFFASLKIAMTVAFIGSIVSETIAANKGIGHLMLVASARFEVPLAFAALLITGAMGVAMYVVAGAFEKRMTGWAVRGVNGVGLTPQG